MTLERNGKEMPKIAYIHKNIKGATLSVIETANEIIKEYQAQGYSLTLRQLYYQFVARDLFDDDRTWSEHNSKWVRDSSGTKNAPPNYKWLGSIVNTGRLLGIIDWDSIEDITRNLNKLSTWAHPSEILSAVAQQFKRDLWVEQHRYVEVWIEKDALLGIIRDICDEWRVPYFSCRGYTSQSEIWAAAQRFSRKIAEGKEPLILHLGDHDPSGIDMTRDVNERMNLFSGSHIEIQRLALNRDQVKKYKLPPNPAKLTDTRAKDYIAEYGKVSWELDALEPRMLSELVGKNIKANIDMNFWETSLEIENDDKEKLQRLSDNWDDNDE